MSRVLLTLALFAALVVSWSSGFIGATMAAATGAPAETTMLWRYLLTAAPLVAIAVGRRRRLSATFLWREGLVGLLSHAIYIYGAYQAAAHGVPTGTNALVASLQPLLVAVTVTVLAGRMLTPRTLLGLAAGLMGVTLVVGTDLGAGGQGAAYGLTMASVAMVALSAGTVLGERWSTGTDVLDRLTVHVVVTVGFMSAIAVPSGRWQPPADPAFWRVQAFIVLVAVMAYVLYLIVLQRHGSVAASALLYLTPGVAAALAWPVFGEILTPIAVAGFTLSAAGVVAILGPARRGRHAPRRALLSGHRSMSGPVTADEHGSSM
ncbi:DMT family transporter [Nocardioides luteus]|uniref:DMT family transporter n=1 Tax=Nocardioides luteus TaxID=1844 RepID=UPI0018CA90D5|nr:DMT family transporter [Nocardioides luteus]MBG6096534.1 drug/metabolite transporter (DMT)-like permease [Nocardioides luteus]